MLEHYYHLDRTLGINIELSGPEFSVCEISVQKNLLNIIQKKAGLKNISEVKKGFAPGYCAVNFTGKGILHKQIPRLEAVDKTNFSQILPNAEFGDFYVQNFTSGKTSFVSVIRKSEADKWLDLLRQNGFVPLMLSLGPYPVAHILPQLNFYDHEIKFDGHLIALDEHHHWLNYQYKPGDNSLYPIKIASEIIADELLIPYAAGFQLALGNNLPLIKAEAAWPDSKFSQVIEARKIKVKAAVILGIFFVLLFLNFVVFSWLDEANNKLTEKVNHTAQNTSDVQELQQQVTKKEALVKELGWNDTLNKSLLIDQLAGLLPTDVKWQTVAVNRFDASASKIQKTLKFFDGQIRITGESEKIIPVNEWLARVKTLKWVKTVQLENYLFNAELNTGEFNAVITY